MGFDLVETGCLLEPHRFLVGGERNRRPVVPLEIVRNDLRVGLVDLSAERRRCSALASERRRF
jgi:hypothetical protein